MYRITKNARKDTIECNIALLKDAIRTQLDWIKEHEKQISATKKWMAKDIAKLDEMKELLKTKF